MGGVVTFLNVSCCQCVQLYFKRQASGISDLPADMRRQIAALVQQSSLPALRLVSRGWNEAANLVVHQLDFERLHPA